MLGKVKCLKQYIILSTSVIVNDKKWNLRKSLKKNHVFWSVIVMLLKCLHKWNSFFFLFETVISISYIKTCKWYYEYYEWYCKYYEWYYEILRGTTRGTTRHYVVIRVVLGDTARYYEWYYETSHLVIVDTTTCFARHEGGATRYYNVGQISCHCVPSILRFKILAKYLRLQYNLVDARNLPNHFLEFLLLLHI